MTISSEEPSFLQRLTGTIEHLLDGPISGMGQRMHSLHNGAQQADRLRARADAQKQASLHKVRREAAARPPARRPTPPPAKGRGADGALLAGVDGFQGNLYAATEMAGEVFGSDGLAAWGKEGRERNVKEAAQYGPALSRKDVHDLRSAAQYGVETLAEFAPTAIGTAAAIGAGILAAPEAAIGATVGGLLLAVPQGWGTVEQAIKAKNPHAKADLKSAAAGTAIGVLDTILPGKVTGKLATRAALKHVDTIIARPLGKLVTAKAIGATIAKDGAIGGATRAGQHATQELAAAEAAGEPVDWRELPVGTAKAFGEGALAGAAFGSGHAAAYQHVDTQLFKRIPNVWVDHLPPRRGVLVEVARGHDVPPSFPVIDRFGDDRIAMSLKTVDLDAPHWLDEKRLGSKLKRDINRVANYNGSNRRAMPIAPDQIKGRAVEFDVPHAGHAAQQKVMKQAVKYGKSKGVAVTFVQVR
jgi:hypothetical protein